MGEKRYTSELDRILKWLSRNGKKYRKSLPWRWISLFEALIADSLFRSNAEQGIVLQMQTTCHLSTAGNFPFFKNEEIPNAENITLLQLQNFHFKKIVGLFREALCVKVFGPSDSLAKKCCVSMALAVGQPSQSLGFFPPLMICQNRLFKMMMSWRLFSRLCALFF